MAVSGITITHQRATVVDFLAPFWEESNSFIIKLPQEETITKCFLVCIMVQSLFIKGAQFSHTVRNWGLPKVSTRALIFQSYILFQPLSLGMWLCLAGSILLAAIFLQLFEVLTSHITQEHNRTKYTLEDSFRTAVNQSKFHCIVSEKTSVTLSISLDKTLNFEHKRMSDIEWTIC